MTPGKERQAWKSLTRFPHLQTNGDDGFEFLRFLPGLLANHEMAKTVDPGAPETCKWEMPFKAAKVIRRERSALHSGQEIVTPIKAEYIRADQFCLPHFSLAKRRRTLPVTRPQPALELAIRNY
jgi:hypothetical protein